MPIFGSFAAWLDSNAQEVTDVVDDRLREEVPEYFEGIDPAAHR